MDKEPNSAIYNKIEVDENAEPVVVKVSADSLVKEDVFDEQIKKKEEKRRKNEERKAHRKELREAGKQLVMTRFLGVTDDKNVEKRQRIFKRIFTISFIVLVVGVLAFTFYNDFFASPNRQPLSWETIISTISGCWYFLIYALISVFLCFFLKGLKLSLLCKSASGKWRFKACIETGIVGLYYNNVTPLAVGGQPFEIYHLSKHGVTGGVASSLPISSFFLNQFAFLILGIVSVVLYGHNTLLIPKETLGAMPTILTVLAIIGLSFSIVMPVLTIVFSIFPKIGGSIVHFVVWLGGKLKLVKNPQISYYKTTRTVVSNSRCIKKLCKNFPVLLLSFLLSFGEHLANSSIAYFTLKFFGFDWPASGLLEWTQVMQLCIILYAAISFVPTPGNSGAADLSFYLIFATGLAAGFAFPAMIIWRFLSFYLIILVGFFFTSAQKRIEKHSHQAIGKKE